MGGDAAARLHVILEIVETEEQFVADLALCQEVFLRPLEESRLLPPELVSLIFSNLSLIAKLNSTLAKELRDRIGLDATYDYISEAADGAGVEWRIGDVFQKTAPFMKIYTTYCQNYERSAAALDLALRQARLAEASGQRVLTVALPQAETGGGARSQSFVAVLREALPSIGGEFATFYSKCLRDKRLRHLTLEDFLCKPVQRVCRYPLLLRELLAETPADHKDFTELQRAAEATEEVATYVNDTKRDVENRKAVVEITRSVEGLSDVDQSTLVQPFRRVVQQGSLQLLSLAEYRTSGKPLKKDTVSCPMHVFVLNDLVFFAKRTGGTDTAPRFKLKHREEIQGAKIALRSRVENPTWGFEVTFTGPKGSRCYTLVAKSMGEMAEWHQSFESCIESQAEISALRARHSGSLASSSRASDDSNISAPNRGLSSPTPSKSEPALASSLHKIQNRKKLSEEELVSKPARSVMSATRNGRSHSIDTRSMDLRALNLARSPDRRRRKSSAGQETTADLVSSEIDSETSVIGRPVGLGPDCAGVSASALMKRLERKGSVSSEDAPQLLDLSALLAGDVGERTDLL